MADRILKISVIFLLFAAWPTSNSHASPDAALIFSEAERFTVKIRSTIEYPHYADKRGTFQGAGFIVDLDRGWIATNAHVVGRNPSKIKIRFKGEEFQSAEAIYIDHYIDFALISVKPNMLPARAISADIDCGAPPNAGSAVGAFGHPHGLDYSGTRGIVSGRQYKWHLDWIQTDAAINKGNSGGPLIDLATRSVIGMNTAKLSRRISDGIGFAIPSLHFCAILERLRMDLDPNPPIIPVELSLNHEQDDGINVMHVYRNAGVQWALQEGDSVIGIFNSSESPKTITSLKTPADLINELRKSNKAVATLIIERDGKKLEANVGLKRKSPMLNKEYLYFSGATVSHTELKDDEFNNPLGFLLIHDIRDESKADVARLKTYDLIKSVDGERFMSIPELSKYLRTRVDDEVSFNLYRRSWSLNSRSTYVVKKLNIEDLKLMRAGSPDQ